MKLLLLTCRNIDKNGGENALIMGRHISLYYEYGVETDILFFHKDTQRAVHDACSGINFLECRVENIYNKLEELLSSGEYQGIVTSGFYDKKCTAFIATMKKKYGFVYVIDIHATIKEIYEYCIPDLYHILGTRYLYIKKKIGFVNSLKVADYAFVVSDEEMVEVNKFLPNHRIQFIKIRCGCTESFDTTSYYVERQEQRGVLGIDDDTLAFVYSGSKDRWQKYDDTVSLFKNIQATGIKCKFAFYTHLDEESKAKLYDELGKENVTVRWVTPQMMKKELTAYDVGVMLRDYKWTNRVAFPNKFSDYIASGLHLVLSDAVVEPYNITKKYQLQMFDATDVANSVRLVASTRKDSLNAYIEQCKKIVDSELLYAMQVRDNCAEFVARMKIISKEG